ncbi:MAG TPA: hypothetical protein VD862_00970, partial [Candidatus Paceibacterota bacterium]|nr:hypothetical protein [Candidatus Paceibacterota bacterium]
MTSFISPRRINKITAILAGFTVVALAIGPVPPQFAGADHDPFGGEQLTNVPICHSGNGTNYATPNTPPSVSSIVGGSGHGGHQYDIIPPFHYDDDGEDATYPGQNWDEEHIAIYNDGACDGPVATPTPEPTPTPTPEPTPTPTPEPTPTPTPE